MRNIILSILLVFMTFTLHAQTWSEVKESGDYLWGEGQGATVAEADRLALADLVSRISIHVMQDFDMVDEETTVGGQKDSKQYVSNRLNTYTQATLTNTERMVLASSRNTASPVS